MRRDECDRMVELVMELGSPVLTQLREILRTGQPRQAAGVSGTAEPAGCGHFVGTLTGTLAGVEPFLSRYCGAADCLRAAADRGRTLLELAEVLDPVVLPEALDEIGMSGDLTAAPPLQVMAKPGESAARLPFVQLKAIESLGRLRDSEALPLLREIVEAKKTFGWIHHRELDRGCAIFVEDRSTLQRADSFRQRD